MRKVIILLLFTVIAFDSFGQYVYWEILQGGCTFGFQKDREGNVVSKNWELKPTTRFLAGSEIRTNLAENKLSPGIQFSFSEWKRFSPTGSYVKQQFSFIYLAICDYNFLRDNQKIMPYAGVGIGFSRVNTDEIGYSFVNNTHFACSPRVGIEIQKRLRLAAEYKYQGNDNNFFCLKAGFVIKVF